MISDYPEFVAPVLVLVSAWLLMVFFLFRYLSTRHPTEYERLGRPTFQQGAFRVIGYLFVRGHRRVGDAKLSLLCDAMLVTFLGAQTLLWYLLFKIQTATAVAVGA